MGIPGAFDLMLRILKSGTKFLIVMFAMTIICTVIWQEFVTDTLYNCTDPGWLDFLSPGDWVHFSQGVVYVPHVVAGRSMSDPDTIKQGWTVTGLWILWYLFVAGSVFVSVVLARRKWIPLEHSA
jgi:hypothetical protein